MDRRFLHETLHNNLDSVTDKRIAILGCGALGANLAVSLARRGFRKFFLFDFDKIDEHNISTQPWTKQDLGRRKVDILNSLLFSISGAESYTYWKRLESAEDIIYGLNEGWEVKADLFIDCFDNMKARAEAYTLGHKLKHLYHVLHTGLSNQNTGEVTWNERYTVPNDIKINDPCNYPLSRTLIDLTVVAASESVLDFLINKTKTDYFINANKLDIRKC